MKIKRSRIMIYIYIFLMAVVAVLILAINLVRPKDEIVKIGYITPGNVGDSGWNSMNYRCVQEACEDMGVELLTISGIDENDGDCKSAVDQLVSAGAEMIILNSSVLAEHMMDQLVNYPDISFYAADSDFEAANLTSYSSRMYQVRYLSGIIAGLYTKTGKIGFVAAYRETPVLRGINAFALGARSVNPQAEVIVAWTNDWDYEKRETELARALIEKENVDLLTYHQYVPYVIDVAEQYGIASIGYYEPVEGASEKYLTCAMCDWTVVFKDMLHGYISGHGNVMESEWIGLESGALTLTRFSPLVSEEAAEKAEDARQRLIEGWHVFSGEIRDNEGNEQCAAGESVSDYTLLHEMDWLTEGVREYAE